MKIKSKQNSAKEWSENKRWNFQVEHRIGTHVNMIREDCHCFHHFSTCSGGAVSAFVIKSISVMIGKLKPHIEHETADAVENNFPMQIRFSQHIKCPNKGIMRDKSQFVGVFNESLSLESTGLIIRTHGIRCACGFSLTNTKTRFFLSRSVSITGQPNSIKHMHEYTSASEFMN